MSKNYAWFVIAILTLLFSFMFAYVYSTPTEGFQDTTDPMLIKMISNLMKSYMELNSKIKDMGIESREIEGTTLEQMVKNQMEKISMLGQKCSQNLCTEAEIKDPSFLSLYNSANAIGETGLPEITFESLAVDSSPSQVSSEMSQTGQAAQASSEMPQAGPETQLPAAQMPASVISSSKPSLDECKRHYRCNISTNME
jgi:hypothetical protein